MRSYFFFKQKYIPEEVAKEWLDGMLYFLPLFHENGDVISKGPYFELLGNELFKNYPRLRNTFRVSWFPNMENPNDREKLIEQMINEVGKKCTCSRIWVRNF